ncbi:BamA/TamA family outer membrane protein, partial [Trichothermofontia sp.]
TRPIPPPTGTSPPPIGNNLKPIQLEPGMAVMVGHVRVVGGSPNIAQFVQNVVTTQAGGSATPEQLEQDVAALLATGVFLTVSYQTYHADAADTGLLVVFQVQPIVVRSLQLLGAKVLHPAKATELLGIQRGEMIDPIALDAGARKINQWYQENGYSLAKVLAIRPSREGVVVLEVLEGVIGAITFRFFDREGSPVDAENQPIPGRTKEAFLREQIKLREGEVFQEPIAQGDLQRLYGLGLFGGVGLSLSGEADQVTVIYDLQEVPSRSLNFGGGYSDSAGIYGTLTYSDRNFNGRGQQLGTNLLVGTRDAQFDVNFKNPYRDTAPDRLGYSFDIFRRRTLALTFTGGDPEVDLPNNDIPRLGRFGGSFALERPLSPDWLGSLGLSYVRSSVRDSDGELSPKDELGNDLSLSGTGIDDLLTVTFEAVNDQRDSRTNPTQGSRLSLSMEQSIPVGLGNILMNRVQADYRYYLPVNWLKFADQPEVLAFNVQGGTVIGNLPPYEAFNLGGLNSVRGYGVAEVGSGRSYVVASTEYRFPIYKIFGGVVFADFGSDLGSGDAVPGEPAEIRGKPGTGFGMGLGVRVQSPVGLIRADYGINDEGDTLLQFGFGQRF